MIRIFVPLRLLQKTDLHDTDGYLSEHKLDGMRKYFLHTTMKQKYIPDIKQIVQTDFYV